jgi:hypothetical protein
MHKFYFVIADVVPNVTDWIQAICSILVLFITIVMASYAKTALKTWKEEKKHDLYVRLKSDYSNYLRSFGKYTMIIRGDLRDSQFPNIKSRIENVFQDMDKWDNELRKANYYINRSFLKDLNSNDEKYQAVLNCYESYHKIFMELTVFIFNLGAFDVKNMVDEKLKEKCNRLDERLKEITKDSKTLNLP